MHRAPVRHNKVSTLASTIGARIHSDILGPMEKPSHSGYRYIITFTDDFSRHSTIYPMFQKSDAFDCYIKYTAMLRQHLSSPTIDPVKVLRTDGDGVYQLQQFQQHLELNGTRHEYTSRARPEDNGRSERFGRTIVEMARAMLANSKFPKQFWLEACTTATYIKNRVTHKATRETPFKRWTGGIPDLSNLQIFGSECLVLSPGQERHKWDPKCKPCLFLGYVENSNYYRVYNPNTSRIIRSPSVSFNLSPIKSVFPDTDTDDSNVQPDPLATESTSLRKSIRQQQNPHLQRYKTYHGLTTTDSEALKPPDTPSTYQQAMNGPHATSWTAALQKELASLSSHGVFSCVEPPPGKTAIDGKYVFKVKDSSDPQKPTFKVRFVGKGFQ